MKPLSAGCPPKAGGCSRLPTASLLDSAQAVVRLAFGAPDATVVGAELLRDRTRSVVARVHVRGAGAATSAIVKAATGDDAHFSTEWASLQFLATLPAAAGVVPRFLGGDVRERLFVIEDLGGSRSLDDVLREPARAPALRALGALGRATARLHLATLGDDPAAHERALDTSSAALPGGRTNERTRDAARWEHDAHASLAAWRDALGVAAPAGLDDALHAVVRVYRDPGDWLAFTHGDPAPTNTHVAADDDAAEVRLLDFEYGGFRHALYDPTAWAVLCPLPADALAAVRDAYRAELATRAPALAGAPFDAAWAAMACWRAVAMLGWLRAATVSENAPWVEEWTRREAALAACERMADEVASSGARALSPLGALGASLAAAMRARWPEYAGRSTLPRWPAFDQP